MGFVNFLKAEWYTILSIALTLISFVYAYIKAKHNGNSKGKLALLEQIPALVTTAESLFGSGKGSAKLDYVLTQLRLYALQNNIKVSVETLTAEVNSVVATTNNVNINKPAVVTPSEDRTAGNELKPTEDTTKDTINI